MNFSETGPEVELCWGVLMNSRIESAAECLGDESESEDTAIAAEASRSADADIGR